MKNKNTVDKEIKEQTAKQTIMSALNNLSYFEAKRILEIALSEIAQKAIVTTSS